MQLKRIIVPLAGAAVDADVIKVAATLAKPNKAEVVAIHAGLDAETERGEQVLEHAATVAQQLGVHLETELLQARDAAAAIIDTARERAADLIVLGMPYRRRLGRVYVGQTVTNVYVGAHCAVLAYRQEEVG